MFTFISPGAVVVPFVMATFNKHRTLFYFMDNSFQLEGGGLNYHYIVQQGLIQIFFVFLTMVLITMLEAKYNRVNLKEIYIQKTFLEYVSQTLIQFWSVLLLLSSVRMTTNYLQCTSIDDICTCRVTDIDLTMYGCPAPLLLTVANSTMNSTF